MHLPCSFVKGDMSNTCNQCLNGGVECHRTVSGQETQTDLCKFNNIPTIKLFLQSYSFLKPGSNAEAAAYCMQIV